MPVRIYDISKKLGLENKDVLVKAKELGIAAAKVASSSLDKITAEYLEGELRKQYPNAAAAAAPEPPPAPPAPPPEPVVVLTAPPPPPVEPPPPVMVAPTPPPPEIVKPEVVIPPAPKLETEAAAPAPVEPPRPPTPAPAPAAPPPPPPPPPAPMGPRLGEKIGFIQLPGKPAPKPPEKPGPRPAPGPQRRPEPGRTDFNKRGDIRSVRSPQAPSGVSTPGARIPGVPKGGGPGKPGDGGADTRPQLPADAPVISIKPPIVVRALAEALKQKPYTIIGDLMKMKEMATVNQAIDEKLAQQICAKYGYRFEAEKRERGGGVVHAPVRKVELDQEDLTADLKPRAPVVTIMGHVDHGKTSLLDVIRKSNVVAGEAGGITQHIGAYTISFPHPERKKELAQITFLDTPGHAAFSSMRARGANVTDIVILVVAANDGVMPQTLEALNHARAAKVPIIVAVNKIDHPNADSLKVRQQLQDKGLVPDDWGGDTIFVEVSALTKQGVDRLIEMILLQADLLELKANPNRRAKGNVIESGLEPGGPTATVLVRKGTLRIGDTMICGEYYGRVRALINEESQRLKEAAPSVAVRVLGLNGVPEAGAEFSVLEDERSARNLAEQRTEESRALGKEGRTKVTLENLFDTLESNQAKALKVVVKADTQGSVEAIVDALKKIESDKVSLEIVHSAVGTITESDVDLASASTAVILGFHTRVDSGVADKAKHDGVQIKLYAIIYELIDEVKEAMAGLLEPILKEIITGAAEVRKVFQLSKGAPVAGSVVASGRIVKGKVRIRRRKEVIYEGVVQSLRRFQDEVTEVRAGMECGIRVEGFTDYQPGDAIESYTVEKVAQKL